MDATAITTVFPITTRTRVVREDGITLPFVIPAIEAPYPGAKFAREERRGEVFIPINELYEIVSETTDDGSELYGAYVNLDNETGYSLLAVGFVTRTTGHSWAGTSALYNWGSENARW